VILPENFEQVRIADLGRIEFDLDRFGVAGTVGADFFVVRIVGVATGVSHLR